MHPREMSELLDRYHEARIADDVGRTLSLMREDVRLEVIGAPFGPHCGREAVGAQLERLRRDLRHLAWRPLRRLFGESFVVEDLMMETQAVGRPLGLDGRGRRIAYRELIVAELGGGLISRLQVWLDVAAVRAQLADDGPVRAESPRITP